MRFNRKFVGIVIASVLTLGALSYVGATALAQGTTPSPTPAATPVPTPAATPTPTPTLSERVAANTAGIANLSSRVILLESQHTWTCATIIEAYDTTYRFSSDTEAEFRRRAVGEAKDVMDAADSNVHRQVRWTDTGVKAELAKCGR